MNKSEKAKLNEIYKTYGLKREHIHVGDDYKIINRAGISTIKYSLGIDIQFTLVHQEGATIVTMHGLGVVSKPLLIEGPNKTEDFGEVSPKNNTFRFPVAVAKKRCESRIVLELAGLHGEYMGEDEIDHQPKGNISNDATKTTDVTLKLIDEAKSDTGGRRRRR